MRRLSLVFPILLAAVACDCSGGLSRGSDGLPEVDKLVVDFGRVRLGENARAELTVVNRGTALLRFEGVDRTDTPSVFRAGEPPKELASGAAATLTLIFAPTQVGQVEGTLVLLSDAQEKPRLSVELRGEGVETLVDVQPETVDFGVVEVDSRVSKTIQLTNEGDVTEEIEVLTLADGSEHFSGGPVPGGGRVIRLEPGASVELPVAFSPRWADPGGFVSTVTLLPCRTCSTITVTLRGVGVDAFLSVDPAPPACLDFGQVNPGSSVTKVVRARNLGALPLSLLTGEITAGGDVFSLDGTFPVEVPGEGDVELALTFAPTDLVASAGTLVLTSDDPKAARVSLCLSGVGGGPDASVQPQLLDFAQVATGASRTRTVRVANLGATTAGGGTPTPLRVSSARVRTGDATGYSVDFQPFELAVGQSRTVSVTFAPSKDGLADDVLEFVTNDTDTPVAEVQLTGRGRDLAPCELALMPASGTLAFGNVERGRTALLPFALRNVGPDDCLVDDLALSSSSNPAFSLPTPPPAQFEVHPGEVFPVHVQFLPQVHASYVGEVTFEVSDPANPIRTVGLSGVSATGCLLVAPGEIDFGVTGAQCITSERTINIYNVCASPVVVEDIALADEPSGSYRLTLPPGVTFPHTMTASMSLAAKVQYRPREFGEHPGGVFVRSDERAEPYLVSLTGSARPDAVQTDHFEQSKRPIDILFVIDDSGSMAPFQQSLATNLESFLQFANSNFVDYRIGITTTDVDGGEMGRLVPLAQSGVWPAAGATPPRVLERTTPDVLRGFKQSVNVGTEGSGTEKGLEAAYQALSPQNLASHNQGFLRDDAMLSVIIVSDEADQSPQDTNFYYGYLLSIKGARRANLLSVSAICEVDPNNSANHGSRYLDLVQRTGGVASSIHTADWAADLERLGLAAFGYKSRFVLTSVPAPDSIEVLIDGVPRPASDEEGVSWRYDPVGNLIEFSPSAIPEPNQTLAVSYSVVCGGD